MKLREIYNLAIKLGKKADPRNEKRLAKILENEKKIYDKLSSTEKSEYDKERLSNPYADTRILHDSGKKVKKVLVGVDISSIELYLAKKLGCDAVISHHPLGEALACLDQVMDLQADLLSQYGVPINIAESLLEKRISEVSRSLSPINHFQMVDAAKLLNISLICVHTPADNLVYRKVKARIDQDKPETVAELITSLKKIYEYKEAAKKQIGPQVFAGKPSRRTGKIALTEITGGTSGSKEIYEKMSQAGIGTIVGMHMGEEHKDEAEKHHLNVVIAGHLASDSVGMNQFLNKLEKYDIKVIPCSGLIRKTN